MGEEHIRNRILVTASASVIHTHYRRVRPARLCSVIIWLTFGGGRPSCCQTR